MFNDGSLIANTPASPVILAESDHSGLEEQNEGILTWESAWIDIGGEG